ncbi:hypothetical protein M404DRAFT_31957 [Pisolithus tinctorius Marx 270]|uniref:Uncharacterized protein n=1 Tax=Pisolithus tinctorius Marx 270 TaxID=870435 RepID=A0A0C3NRF7_PISTI|nr:hypothetical protein M404DRAFT_31957 [Pisolithus tinctorius Marx 270]
MSSQHQSKTPQPTPGHACNYSQVVDKELVVLTDDSTDTEQEKTAEKARRREENKRRERECEAEQEERLEAEWRKRAEEEEEARRKKAAEEEAERQRQRAQARRDEAGQSAVYDVTTAQRVPGTSVVVTTIRRPLCTRCIEDAVAEPSWKRAGTGSSQGEKKKILRGKGKEKATEPEEVDNEWEAGEEDEEEPMMPHEGPSRTGDSLRWAEWEWERQLQVAERYVEAHKRATMAFKRMAAAAERMAEVAERTADQWGVYCAWVEWAEMRRRADVHEATLKRTGGGWKRPQSKAAEDKNEEVDKGAEGDNEEEEEVGGEKEGGEEQGGDGGQVMEE